jgi:hypothetical protein
VSRTNKFGTHYLYMSVSFGGVIASFCIVLYFLVFFCIFLYLSASFGGMRAPFAVSVVPTWFHSVVTRALLWCQCCEAVVMELHFYNACYDIVTMLSQGYHYGVT